VVTGDLEKYGISHLNKELKLHPSQPYTSYLNYIYIYTTLTRKNEKGKETVYIVTGRLVQQQHSCYSDTRLE